jgi:hypothetical protein
MAALLLASLPWFADLATHGWATRGLRLGLVCMGGSVVYFAVLAAQRPAFFARMRRTVPRWN